MKTSFITISFIFLLGVYYAFSQSLTQTVNGKIVDRVTREALPFVNIVLMDSNPVIGTTSDAEGNFSLEKVPVGRQNIRVSMIGYEAYVVNELLVNSGREINLNIELEPSSEELEEVVVTVRKDEPLNTMSTVSSRQFTVEETERYAGGLNDPARLASSFAGVATPSVSSNGISVRGNSPNGLLWQIEGVEVPNPNHFANLTVAGGGLLTALSNQVMANSDFLTGAFPAEYGNGTSGVFDINLRNGNTSKRSYTFQAGLIGIDFATEGPFKAGSESSYLVNYRNSTMAMIAPLLPENTGILKYQDLAFKTQFPTKNAGTFTFWGIGALDGQEMTAEDSVEWEMDGDRDNSETSLYMFASGLSHSARLGSKSFLKTTLSATGSGLSHEESRLGFDKVIRPQSDARNNSWRTSLQMDLDHYFSPTHSNKSGFQYSQIGYDVKIDQSQAEGEMPELLSKDNGNTGLVQLYTQSTIEPAQNLTLNLGLHSQLFLLNNNYSIEPRAGIKYRLNDVQSLGFAYGLNSQIEQLPVYFVQKDGQYPNKDLELMKSSHFVLSYNLKLNDHIRFSVEPYYQRLTNVPVSPTGYVSTINFEEELFFDQPLVSDGTGKNVGIDFTLERFMHRGFYYLVTASFFDSKYTGADQVERNTHYNRNYVFNFLAGKEWQVGNNLLTASIRLNYLGGSRKEPINREASLAAKDVIYGESAGNLAYSEKFDDQPVLSFNISYRKNRPRHSSVWSLQILNAMGTEEFDTDFYNLKTGKIDTRFTGVMVPNLSYKIEF